MWSGGSIAYLRYERDVGSPPHHSLNLSSPIKPKFESAEIKPYRQKDVAATTCPVRVGYSRRQMEMWL